MYLLSRRDDFFLPPELEPKIPKKQRERAITALRHHASSLILRDDDEFAKGCCASLVCKRNRRGTQDDNEDTPSTEIIPEMERASDQGWSMIKSIVFPSLPAVLQDLWVYLELIVSILAFAFAIVDIFPIESNFSFKYAYFALATVSIILALTDGYFYFFQHGSCARGLQVCQKKIKSEEVADVDNKSNNDISMESNTKQCCKLSKKSQECFNKWFEFGRNIATELILYPLLMFDMFDFVTSHVYEPTDPLGRTNFSLFVIGGFYLILSVYIIRVFMVAGSMISLVRIPSEKMSGDTNGSLLVKFCAHIFGQIIVHFMIILVIGVKIFDEHREADHGSVMNFTLAENETMDVTSFHMDSGGHGTDIQASPFLITAIILGGIIPIAGVMAFFVVNYYWIKEFSIGFWINMVSLLRSKSFAEAVFGGEGITEAKSKVEQFLEKTKYQQVKKHLKRFKAPSLWTKFFFPARVPLTAISGLLYDIILLTFLACLMLTSKNGIVKLAVFSDDLLMTVVFVISATIIILANIHILILLNVILFTVVLIFVLAFGIAMFLSPLLLLIYIPVIIYLGYFVLFYQIGASLKSKHHRSKLSRDHDRSTPLYYSVAAYDKVNIDYMKQDECIKVSLSMERDLDDTIIV